MHECKCEITRVYNYNGKKIENSFIMWMNKKKITNTVHFEHSITQYLCLYNFHYSSALQLWNHRDLFIENSRNSKIENRINCMNDWNKSKILFLKKCMKN